MSPILFHVWGPLSINAYGAMIAIGVSLAFILAARDSILQKLISQDRLIMSFHLMILSGYFGGRICCMLSNEKTNIDYSFLFKFWEPGLSIMGSIIGCSITMIIYLYIIKIPILPYMDRIALYAPIVQAFGRIGCFFAGCCYGKSLTAWWSVIYKDPNHMAPLHQSLHPAQLYSSAILFALFFFMFFITQHHIKKPGILFCTYLFFASLERFLIDFIRWDRAFIGGSGFFSYLSIHQWIALVVCFSAGIAAICIDKWTKKSYGSI